VVAASDPPTGRQRLVLTRHLPAPVMTRLGRDYAMWHLPVDRALTPAELAVAAQNADALLVMATDRIDRTFIDSLPAALRVVATLSVGHDHIDLEAMRRRGIAVVFTPDVLSDAVAELGMLLMLGAARRAREGAELMRQRAWTGWSPTQLLGIGITGKRLGIFGMGRIGRALARRARGFDMEIHYHNRHRLPVAEEQNAHFHATFDAMLRVSDILMIVAPATPETKGIFNARAIDLMPNGALVCNVGRGSVIDDEALIAALRSGRLGGAGLDVFNGEPNIHTGYYDTPTAFLQPHQGSSTWETRVRMCTLLVDEIDAVFQGRPLSSRLV
jgi:lactate dehydrogenase-like 2-hydroxyacid dehydrogenase